MAANATFVSERELISHEMSLETACRLPSARTSSDSGTPHRPERPQLTLIRSTLVRREPVAELTGNFIRHGCVPLSNTVNPRRRMGPGEGKRAAPGSPTENWWRFVAMPTVEGKSFSRLFGGRGTRSRAAPPVRVLRHSAQSCTTVRDRILS